MTVYTLPDMPYVSGHVLHSIFWNNLRPGFDAAQRALLAGDIPGQA
ncbi:hypothetical protein [Actinoplanes sp. NBRC 103695]|nr:hypothetical protein [Actinoplanes sp. NBRC 103695]GLZ02078.1 hypothetical protein Acsp02_93290 [Actinoplanes sp. NBRC 103695]